MSAPPWARALAADNPDRAVGGRSDPHTCANASMADDDILAWSGQLARKSPDADVGVPRAWNCTTRARAFACGRRNLCIAAIRDARDIDQCSVQRAHRRASLSP